MQQSSTPVEPRHNGVAFSRRRPARQVLLWMALFLAVSLGVSAGLRRIVAPVGDRIVAGIQERQRTLTGVVTPNTVPAGDNRSAYTLYDGRKYYPLQEKQVLHALAGHRVTLTGSLNARTGMMEISSVRLAD